MAGPCSPTSPVTAQLISRRWRIISFWCYADCQQRSNQRLVVLPQTRSSSFHGVKQFSRLDGRKLFKNIRLYGWAVLPLTRPSSFHDVEEPFRLDVMHTFKTIQVYGWASLPHIPCHGPTHFAALKNLFVVKLCRLSTTFKSTAGRAPPKSIELISRSSSIFSSGCYKAFWNTIKFMAGPCSPKHGPVPFTVLNNFFCLDVMQPFKTIQVYGWTALPNISCHGPAHFTALKNLFVVKLCRLSTTFKSTAGRAPPNTIQLISRC